jgi:hypothetical protein
VNLLTTKATAWVVRAADNPLDNVTPDMGVFGNEFEQAWIRIAGGIWMLAILAVVVFGMVALAGMASSRGGGHPQRYAEKKEHATTAGMSFLALLLLGVIIGALIKLSGQ